MVVVRSYQFSEAVREVVEIIRTHQNLNLVIEAPLSIAFDINGNPKGRNVEYIDNKYRYWHTGPGAVVSLASLIFMKRLLDSKPFNTISLFEGLVSFKSKTRRSNHEEDVLALKRAIMSQSPARIPEPHRRAKGDTVESIFNVIGHDLGIPPVIEGGKNGNT